MAGFNKLPDRGGTRGEHQMAETVMLVSRMFQYFHRFQTGSCKTSYLPACGEFNGLNFQEPMLIWNPGISCFCFKLSNMILYASGTCF